MKKLNCISCKNPMEDDGYIIEDIVGYPSSHDGSEISFHLCDTCITSIKAEEDERLGYAIKEAQEDIGLSLLDYFAAQIYSKINELSGTLYDNWFEMPLGSQAQYLRLAESVEDNFIASTNKNLKTQTMSDYALWKHNEIMQIRIRKEHEEQSIGSDGKLLSSSEIHAKILKRRIE